MVLLGSGADIVLIFVISSKMGRCIFSCEAPSSGRPAPSTCLENVFCYLTMPPHSRAQTRTQVQGNECQPEDVPNLDPEEILRVCCLHSENSCLIHTN